MTRRRRRPTELFAQDALDSHSPLSSEKHKMLSIYETCSSSSFLVFLLYYARKAAAILTFRVAFLYGALWYNSFTLRIGLPSVSYLMPKLLSYLCSLLSAAIAR